MESGQDRHLKVDFKPVSALECPFLPFHTAKKGGMRISTQGDIRP
jgi:hypothetical protein